MKYVRIVIFVSVLFLALFLGLSSVQAQTTATSNYRVFTILILKNPVTRHLYFAPTYPGCIAGPTLIRVEDQTNSSTYILTDRQQFIRAVAHQTTAIVEYVTPWQRFSYWTMIERPIYGGNAFIYFRSCFARLGPPMPIYPMQAIPANSVQNGPPPVPSQLRPAPIVPPAPSNSDTTQQQGQRIGAICNDGTHSFALGAGACAFHRGVNHWLYN